jgi:hypothetical protein
VRAATLSCVPRRGGGAGWRAWRIEQRWATDGRTPAVKCGGGGGNGAPLSSFLWKWRERRGAGEWAEERLGQSGVKGAGMVRVANRSCATALGGPSPMTTQRAPLVHGRVAAFEWECGSKGARAWARPKWPRPGKWSDDLLSEKTYFCFCFFNFYFT